MTVFPLSSGVLPSGMGVTSLFSPVGIEEHATSKDAVDRRKTLQKKQRQAFMNRSRTSSAIECSPEAV